MFLDQFPMQSMLKSESVVDSDYMKSMLNSSYVLDQFTIYAEA
jgi:hypothetical protein